MVRNESTDDSRLIRSDENGASDKAHLVFQHIPVRTFPEKCAGAPSCCLEEDFFLFFCLWKRRCRASEGPRKAGKNFLTVFSTELQ